MKILIIEDDMRTASFISKGLKQAGFITEHAADGEDAHQRISAESYDIAIIDIMLPKLDGLTLIDQLRKKNIRIPIIVLSAKSSVDDRIKGLQAGGDDYLIKPFAFSELLARVYALIRRANAQPEPNFLKHGDLSMDVLKRKVLRDGKNIELQPKEFALLEYLLRNAGRVVSKTMIIEHVWDYSFDPNTNIVEVSICRLREKIDRPFCRPLIYTIRSIGYVLEERR